MYRCIYICDFLQKIKVGQMPYLAQRGAPPLSVVPLGWCVVAETGCNCYLFNINIFPLSKKSSASPLVTSCHEFIIPCRWTTNDPSRSVTNSHEQIWCHLGLCLDCLVGVVTTGQTRSWLFCLGGLNTYKFTCSWLFCLGGLNTYKY
jgi:hypothetical protein